MFLQLGLKQSMLSKCVVNKSLSLLPNVHMPLYANFNFANRFKKILLLLARLIIYDTLDPHKALPLKMPVGDSAGSVPD